MEIEDVAVVMEPSEVKALVRRCIRKAFRDQSGSK
ncbi:MAG: hypothetical protein QOK37_1710 [Thermoanaerobaculia bacterium]|jgi:hypothetical protein|nr:hypothetical protein [Thermoanaerobaculia bacterium]